MTADRRRPSLGGLGLVNRMIGVALSSVLVASLIAVGASQVVSRGVTAKPSTDLAANPITISGIVGTEKGAYFADPAVKQRLAALGLTVNVDTAGSRQMATAKNLKDYDFAFPSSAPVADKIIRANKPISTNAPFYSPIAIATFQPIVQVLSLVNVTKPNVGGYQSFDVGAYLELTKKGTRWDQLPRNASYPAKKAVLVSTNDVRSSNAAAMYLAIGSYVANGNKPVSNEAEISKVMPAIGQLFLGQGYSESWSESSFEDYLALGIGKTPMLLTYESQFLEYQLRKDGSLGPDMVLMYPVPEVQSKHIVINLTPGGARLGEALQNDPELQRLAAKHGFRTINPAVFTEVTSGSGPTPPVLLAQVIDPPRYEILESMINHLAKLY